MVERAVFFDRDGVINDTDVDLSIPKSFAPRKPEDLRIFPGVAEIIRNLKNAGFVIIVVSNQPDIALGKIDESTRAALEGKFESLIKIEGIPVEEIYYCHHHPDSTNPDYPKNCDCRKPKPGMLIRAGRRYKINLEDSWVIGDTDKDINAGKAAGCKTILLRRPWSEEANCQPDFVIENLKESVDIILKGK